LPPSSLQVGRGTGLEPPITAGAAVGELVTLEKSLAWLELPPPKMPVKRSAATAPPATKMTATTRNSRWVFFHSQPQQLT